MNKKKQTIRVRLDSISTTDLENNLGNIVINITNSFQEFKNKGYTNLTFEKNEHQSDYGYEQLQDNSYVLWGDREETELEVQKRVKKEKSALEQNKKRKERAEHYEKVRKKMREERDYKEFLRLQAKFQKESSETQK